MVSVVIPVYNTEKYLKQCLDSIIHQTFDDIEIIAINDGSTDNSLEILKSYSKKYSDKLKIIDSINQGAGKARNLGIDASSGEYIWFVDSDDWLYPSAIEKMYNAAKCYNVSMVTCEFQRRIGGIKKNSSFKYDSSLINLDECPNQLGIAKPSIGNKLIKKSLIGEMRMPGLKWEDLSFTYVLAADSRKFYHLVDHTYNYRMSMNNTTTRDMIIPSPRIIEIFDVLLILEQHFKERGLYKKYEEQLKYIYVVHVLRRIADVTMWFNCSFDSKRKIINLLVNMIKLKYADIDINKFIQEELPFNFVSSYFLKKYGISLIDENRELKMNETEIKKDIVKILK